MARRDTYVTTAALLAVLAGASWVSYAVTQGREAYGIEVSSVETPATERATAEDPQPQFVLSVDAGLSGGVGAISASRTGSPAP
ncbi:hypothetical protein [Streptomyces spongiae]|uniref:Uncharacterized protein n=1 Tax=Streptomyces spongiae TaxID=565072 RepID=A0A5N8XTX7_9ACTN|nr:hypothetical protein [Streptomyces spongiae]MPY62851.1 hypothetical protein [Streptomyces spongiae]